MCREHINYSIKKRSSKILLDLFKYKSETCIVERKTANNQLLLRRAVMSILQRNAMLQNQNLIIIMLVAAYTPNEALTASILAFAALSAATYSARDFISPRTSM